MAGRYAFLGVTVGFPSKVRGNEAEEEWQEVDWVTWSTGELAIDSAASYLLVFKPTASGGGGGAGAVKAKPLGSLIRASAVAPDDETRVVTTSDPLHKLLRLTFPSTEQAVNFSKLADAAEAAWVAADSLRESNKEVSAAREAAAQFEEELREALSGRWPLVFGGVELYGPDRVSEDASEVLLCRGAAVLLDPPEETSQVGTYELLMYSEDEGKREPAKRFTIGPKMALTRQQPAAQDTDGPAAALQLSSPVKNLPPHVFTFDDASVAAAFSRDFRVRQRLMDVSLKTVKRSQAANELRGEIEEMKQRSFCARLFRLLRFLIVLLILGVGVRVASLYAKDQGARAPAAYLEILRDDVQTGMALSQAAARELGAMGCKAAVGSVPAGAVRRCAALATEGSGAVHSTRRCLEALVDP